ncbi:uncharacterized protein LOC121732529 [Aricia agestis]|uniref:uncharacterized protein LOC121732529 n=1 Tax=Aricia agestis TaxID=91739 RepID=UPI001C20384E|nr:uncharacterized protein LOC121732529 [Aricia agestis]
MALSICNSDNFDVEQFIAEIQKRHSIWNLKSKEYNNRPRKIRDWEEVCEAMVPDYPERNREEKTEIENELQNKWKVLRDCFVRSLRNQNRASAMGSVARPYKHHDLLTFLLVTFKHSSRRRKYNYKAVIRKHEDAQKEQEPEKNSPVDSTKIVKKMKVRNVEVPLAHQERNVDATEDLVETITNNVVKKINSDNHDEDRQFLLCLLNDIKRIPSEMKLDAKSDIINVIRHYTSRSSKQTPIHLEYMEDPLVTMQMSDSESEKEFKVNLTN